MYSCIYTHAAETEWLAKKTTRCTGYTIQVEINLICQIRSLFRFPYTFLRFDINTS